MRRRLSEDAPRLLTLEVKRPPEGARAPLSYVTSDGLVRVPDGVRHALGVVRGGRVTFVEGKDRLFYLLGDALVLDMIDLGARQHRPRVRPAPPRGALRATAQRLVG